MRSFSRFFAVMLIALVVSPVTAPFAVCDLSAIVAEDGHSTTDAKLLKDCTSLVTLVESPIGFGGSTLLFAVVAARVAHGRQIAPPILRL
jgi:hypothetical protein